MLLPNNLFAADKKIALLWIQSFYRLQTSSCELLSLSSAQKSYTPPHRIEVHPQRYDVPTKLEVFSI